MKYLLILCISFAFAISTFAQNTGTVSGKITFVNKNPTPLTILLKKDGREVRCVESDISGAYVIRNLSDGLYEVSVFHGQNLVPGGGARMISINDGRAAVVDFALDFFWSTAQPGPFPIRETVTVSAGQSQTIEQVSKTVDVISGQEMRERADFSLIETLRTIPGFRVAQLGGFGRTANIKTRGLRNQDTAVLIDGIRFRDPAAITGDASPFLSDFTLTSVSKIEVLRGSGSSLYGTNAIGGVVDFQTPTTQQGTHGQIAGAFGGLGLGRFRGNISHGLDNGRFGINAGLSRTVYTKGIDGQDDAHNTNFQTRFDANPFAKTEISGRIFFSDADVRLNVSPDTLGTLPPSTATIIDALPGVNFTPDLNDPDATQKSRFFIGQISVNQTITSDIVVSGYYQGLTSRRRNVDGPLGPGYQSAYTSIFDGQIHAANSRVTWTAGGKNTLTAGYEYEFEKFGYDGSTPSGTSNFFTRTRQSSNTFYVQDLVSLDDGRLQFAGGFRAQWFSLKRPQCGTLSSCPRAIDNTTSPPASYTGDVSAAYYFRRSGTKLRAHVGNGYRVPSLYERFGSYFFFGAFFPLGNPGLKPERSLGLDGGIEQNISNGRVKLTATYFYTKVNDEVAYLPTDDFGAPSYYNFDKHFSRGAEISAKLQPFDATDIFASYTFTNSDVRNFRRPPFPVGPVSSSDRKAYGIPDHQFTLVATQRFGKAWINFDFLATSTYLAPIFSNSNFNTYIYRFKGNRKGDLTAGYTFGFSKDQRTLRIYGTVENVFDQEYYENGFRTAGATARVGMTFGF